MIEEKKKTTRSKIIEKFSLSSKLREESKSNDLFEIMVGNLTLEELIALKLELTYKNVGTPLYGIPLYRVLLSIVQDSLFKFALSTNPNLNRARMFLGMNTRQFYGYMKKYSVEEYIIPKEKGDDTN
jgi:hypothetical protein